VTVRFTSRPAPGDITGVPLRLPYVLLCTQGERWCGWHRTANTPRQLADHARDRRVHASSCRGGLIIATTIPRGPRAPVNLRLG
jgi:hypothetical protein